MPNVLQLVVDVTTKNAKALDNVSQDIQKFGQRAQQADRQLLELRKAGDVLTKTIGRQRNALQTATSAQRDLIKAGINAATAQKRLNQEKITAITREKQHIALLTRQARETDRLQRTFQSASQAGGLLARAGQGLVSAFGGFAALDIASRMADFARGAAEASIQLDSQTRALEVLTGSAVTARQAIRQIQDLADEPGLRFQQAVDGAVALRAIGVEAETTTRILRELANAAAFSGQTGEFERALLGLRQIIQRARVSQEELNQITENIGLASRALKEEFGTVLAEDIQAELDATGQSIDDFVERFLTALERLDRFPLDAPSVKLNQLSNSFRELQAVIGDRFLPALASGAEGLTAFFDAIREFIDNTDVSKEVIDELNKSLASEIDVSQKIQAIQATIDIFEELEQRTQDENKALVALYGLLNNSPEAFGKATREIEYHEGAIQTLQSEIDTIRGKMEEFGESHRAYGVWENALLDLEPRLSEHQRLLTTISDALETATKAQGEQARSTDDLAKRTQSLTTAITEAVNATKALAPPIISAEQAISQQLTPSFEASALAVAKYTGNLAELQQIFERYAKYGARLDAFSVSVVDTDTEANTLNSVSQQIVQQNQAAEGLAHSLERVVRATDAHNAALVNPAVSDAVQSFREYAQKIGDVNLAYEKVTPITQDFVDGLGRQASAMDKFSRSIDNTLPKLDAFFNRVSANTIDIFNENVLKTSNTFIPGLNRSLNLSQEELAKLRQAAMDATPDFLFEAIDNLDAITLDNLIGEFSRLDGVIGELGTKIGQFDVAGLASGNPASIATLPFQLYNAFTFDQQQADALLPELHQQNQAAYEAGEFGIPPDLLAFGREQIANALAALAETGFDELQASIEALAPVIGETSLDEVGTLPNRIIETIQTFTDSVVEGLQETLDQAKSDLTLAQEAGGREAVNTALQEVIEATTALYQEQIDSYNLQRQATGRMVGNVEELNNILNELNNEVRLQLESPTFNIQAIRDRQAEARATAERTGTDRQYTEDIARAQYGSSFYDAELAAAEQFHQQLAAGEQGLSENLQAITAERNQSLLELTRNFVDESVGAFQELQETIEEIRSIPIETDIQEAIERVQQGTLEWREQEQLRVLDLQRNLSLQEQNVLRDIRGGREDAAIAQFNEQIAASMQQFLDEQGSLLQTLEGTSIEMADSISNTTSEMSSSLMDASSSLMDAGSAMGLSLADASGSLMNAAAQLSNISITVNVEGGDARIFHNPIHDMIAFQAGQRGTGSTQRRQFLQQSAEDAATYYERGREQATIGRPQGFSQPVEFKIEIPVGQEVIQAVTRGIIEGQDDGSNWQFTRS